MNGTGPAILLTLNLAAVTTLFLFVLGTPLAWWLANTRSRLRPVIEAITALPLILPPTVIGFYLLILLNPTAPIGRFWVTVTGDTLTFSFAGLVIASILYSLPFMVQPLQTAFDRIGRDQIEAAASLGASPLDRFFSLVLPLSARGFLTAGILTFIHTIGEFGVVLMVGGNIPGRTRTLSITLYDHVEALRYDQAHALAAGLVILSLIVLSLVYWLNRRSPRHDG